MKIRSIFILLLFPAALLNAASLDQAFQAAEAGQAEESLRLLEEAYRLDPSSWVVRNEYAWALVNHGKYQEAELVLADLRPVRREDDLAQLAKARALLGVGKPEDARRWLGSLIDKRPQWTLAHFYNGMEADLSKRTDQAVAAFQRVLKEDSHFVDVRPYLARLHEQRKEMDEAWKQYARMAAADDRNAQAREGMARLGPVITRRPEDLIPPKKITSHTPVPAVAETKRLLRIKVGIGTTSGGEPSTKKTLSFRTSQPFVIWDPETGKELRAAVAFSTYTIRLNQAGFVAEIVDPAGASLGRFMRTVGIRFQGTEPATTILNSLNFAPNTSWGGMADREIRGDLEIRVNARWKTLVVVNHLSVEEYLTGVLAAEMPVHFPMEALKAQAVITRTQALFRKGLHRKYGYDVCDEQHCQVYTGVVVESPKVREAVAATQGKYLAFEGRPAHTVFSSNCGGLTQSGGQAGWGEVPYWKCFYDGLVGNGPVNAEPAPASLSELRAWLEGISPAYCQSSKYTWHPEYRWTRVVAADDISRKVAKKKNIGKIKSLKILERNRSGRVKKLELVGTKATLTLSREHLIRKYLGLGSLRSTLFVVDTIYREGRPDSFIFFGGGWGHGVGFCQSGAAGRAETGDDFEKILKAYFSGAVLKLL